MLRKWLYTSARGSHARNRAVRSLFLFRNKADVVDSPPVSPWRGEPSLEEILSDPIVGALMKADGVEAHEIQAMLRHLTRRRDVMLRRDLHIRAD